MLTLTPASSAEGPILAMERAHGWAHNQLEPFVQGQWVQLNHARTETASPSAGRAARKTNITPD